MKKHKIYIYLVATLSFPAIIFAFSLKDSTFSQTIGYVLEVIRILIPILSAIAFITFFWGLSKFLLNSGKPEEIKNGRSYMLWGILALFILLSFMAIVKFISKDLEIGSNPSVPGVLLKTS
ncbi:MAG TPA: hypothetical protein VJC13_02485 [Candidatus Paceibacterota bacterium]